MPRGAVALRRGASPSRIWQLAWPLVGALHARRPLGSDGNEGNSPGPRRPDRFFADLTPTRRRSSSVACTPPWVILFRCHHFALFCCYRRGTLGSGWLLSRPGCALSLVSGDASAARLQCPSPPAAISTAVSFQPVSSDPDAYRIVNKQTPCSRCVSSFCCSGLAKQSDACHMLPNLHRLHQLPKKLPSRSSSGSEPILLRPVWFFEAQRSTPALLLDEQNQHATARSTYARFLPSVHVARCAQSRRRGLLHREAWPNHDAHPEILHQQLSSTEEINRRNGSSVRVMLMKRNTPNAFLHQGSLRQQLPSWRALA
ncbi:hypothetical protein CPLU01_01268 [Colletotrichum plurivorum]|uniref:Uncharacterized protein n=1 Tax=Colletotrichum plurivorum TaxID=2175906 RepID=A0A8H6NPP1_9PEZI|nr:hypothetical protein CPLU01_01268 [Colletotrichum plurivorum]